MRICRKCHNEDRNVTGCTRRHIKHYGVYIQSKCDICGLKQWLKPCYYYDLLHKNEDESNDAIRMQNLP